MARAYSLDLRERVVAAVGDGQTCRQVAATLSGERCERREVVAASSARPAAPAPQADGRPALVSASWMASERWLLARLAEKPDLTLHALLGPNCDERGITVSCDTLWRFLRVRQGSASKKTVFASEQDRPDVARRRAWWKKYQGTHRSEGGLVFIDETWAKTNMTRTHGWNAAWPAA